MAEERSPLLYILISNLRQSFKRVYFLLRQTWCQLISGPELRDISQQCWHSNFIVGLQFQEYTKPLTPVSSSMWAPMNQDPEEHFLANDLAALQQPNELYHPGSSFFYMRWSDVWCNDWGDDGKFYSKSQHYRDCPTPKTVKTTLTTAFLVSEATPTIQASILRQWEVLGISVVILKFDSPQFCFISVSL